MYYVYYNKYIYTCQFFDITYKKIKNLKNSVIYI